MPLEQTPGHHTSGQPFDPNDTARIDSLNERFEGSTFGSLVGEVETSATFPGSTIVTFEKDGEFIRYAVHRNSSGDLQGTEFSLVEDKEGAWVNSDAPISKLGTSLYKNGKPSFMVRGNYHMHQAELEKLEKVLDQKKVTV